MVPDGGWYDWYTGVRSEGPLPGMTRSVTETSPVGLHVRAGAILPLQRPANTTYYRWMCTHLNIEYKHLNKNVS